MNVTVVLLDGGQFEVENIKKDTLGKHVFKNACNQIGLKDDERDYFGLRFVNKQDGEFQWIDNERSVKTQLGKDAKETVRHILHFAAKFFPSNPTNIKQDLTRYQFVLQLRESLLNGRLECSMPIYALLASFVVQAEFGDYNQQEHGDNYLEDFRFCPDQQPELIEKIHDYHKRHKGMNPEQAELNFLDNVRKLPMYGVHRHLALDVNNEKVFIGVSCVGITVYRGNRLMSTFVWPKILSIGFKSKKFYVKIKPADEDDDFCNTSVGFKLSDRVAAKRLWKICVEHHTFFRLENVDLAEKKGIFSRFGSPFRYRGKTENEIMKEQPAPDEPFSRVSSKRFSERVLKSNRKEPEDAKPEPKKEVSSAKEEEQTDSSPPATVPAIKVQEVATPSKVDEVESIPEPDVKNTANVPEIKVVEASPKLKVKSIKADADVGEEEEDEKSESSEEPKKGTTEDEGPAVVTEETQMIISNPLAGGDVKSTFTSHSVTTTTHTTQSSPDGDEVTSGTSATVISSKQVVTTSETKEEIVTTSSTTKTLLQTSLEHPDDELDIGLV